MSSQAELEFILKMHDEASATMQKIGEGLKAMGTEGKKAGDGAKKAGDGLDDLDAKAKKAIKTLTTFKGILGTIAAAAGAGFGLSALSGAITSGMRYVEDAGSYMDKFDLVLRKTGNTAQTSGKEFKKWAEDLEKSTGRSATAMMELAANAASFKFDKSVFYDVLNLADDMASAWGGDVRQNFEGLARALDDPIKGFAMLRARGISLTDQQANMVKHLVATNQQLAAQKYIIDALNKDIGGSAKAGFSGMDAGISKAATSLRLFGEALVNFTGINNIIGAVGTGISKVFDLMTLAINGVSWALDKLPSGLKTFLQVATLLVPTLAAATLAFKALGAMLTIGPVILRLVGFTGLLSGSMSFLAATTSMASAAFARFLPIAIGLLAGKAAQAGGDWISDWVERNVGQETQDKLASFRHRFEGFFDFMAIDPLNQVIQSGPNAGKNFFTGVQEYVKDQDGVWVEAKVAIDTEDFKKQLAELSQLTTGFGLELIAPISDEEYKALEGLDDMIAKRKKLKEAEEALNVARKTSPEMREARGITDDDIKRMERRLELQKKQLEDPIGFALRGNEDELDSIKAVTGEQKNQLEIRKRIREVAEAQGVSEEEAAKRVSKLYGEIQKARADKDYADVTRGLSEQLDAAQAVTQARRDEIEALKIIKDYNEKNTALTAEQEANIRKQIAAVSAQKKATAYGDMLRDANRELALSRQLTEEGRRRLEVQYELQDFERQHGTLTPDKKAAVEGALNAAAQSKALIELNTQLNPVAAATADFNESQRVLNQALADGSITAAEYGNMLRKLDLQTQDKRDPFAAQLRSLKEQADVARIGGEYRDADRRTLTTINQLQKDGLVLSTQQKEQLAAANRELTNIEKSQNEGINGWMNSVGTLRDNMMDLTKDFASGLSGAITGVLTGQQGAVTGFLRTISTKMVSIFVDQSLKGLFSGQGASGASGAAGGISGFFQKLLGQTPKADNDNSPATAVQDALSALTTGTMTVTAASVIVNGSGIGGLAQGGAAQPMAFAGGAGGSTFSPADLAKMDTQAASASAVMTDAQKRLAGSAKGVFADLAPKIKADLMRDLNLTKEQAAGVVGNLGAETGGFKHLQELNPTVKGSKGGLGWAQWTGMTKGNPRRKEFEQYSASQGLSTDSYAANYGNLVRELKGSHKGALNDLRQQSTVEGSTMSFLNKFEKAGIPHSQARINWANKAYGMGAGTPSTGGAGTMGAMGGANTQVAEVTQQFKQQMTAANQNIAQQMPQQFAQPMQNVGQQFSQILTPQAGNGGLGQMAQQMTAIQQSTAQAVPQVGQFGAGIGQLLGPLSQAVPGLGQFGGAIMQLLQQLMSSGGGMGGGMGGILGLVGGLFHEGGSVGMGKPASGFRTLPATAWANAPRFHNGLKSDEYTAILQRGERVLTANDNDKTERVISGLTSALAASGSRPSGNRGGNGNGNGGLTQNITVNAKDANSFRRSEGQIMAESSINMRRSGGRNT